MSDPMGTTRPVSITLDKQARVLRIGWADNHQSAYDIDALREACPCASCRGGHEFMGEAHDPDLLELKPLKHYEVEHLEISGNYALHISWDDGHDAGFYTWDYLRRISPD
ncbi:MAG: DUF971 domain-containing protein [Anaerolineae bacterium]|nr:DUF971 domain-containing protein [Anaerolineae bacterium]